MLYKNLGKTKQKISALGFGGGIGGAKSATSDYTGIDLSLRKSIDLGVNFIDTSPIYGNGESEIIIGSVIKDIREDIVLATKVLPGKTDYYGVIESVEESLRRLKTDYIDLYQVHWPNPTIPMSETVGAMEDLISQGKIKYFGVSNFSFQEIKNASNTLSTNSLTSVQVEYNFCERSIENDVLPFCQERGVTTIAYTPLMRGRMAGNADQRKLLQKLSKQYDASIAQMILSWIIKIPSVVVLSNTKNLDRVDENFRACDITLSDKDHELISNTCMPPIQMISTKFILASSDVPKTGYISLEEALDNNLDWTPSPLELSKQMTRGGFLKPIRLRRVFKGSQPCLEILEGKLRFWAWVSAFGWNKKIPSIVWEDE